MNRYFKILMLFQYIIPFSKYRKCYRTFINNKSENYIFYKNGNKIILVDNEEKEVNLTSIKGLTIKVTGFNNIIKIKSPYIFGNTNIFINGDNNTIEIKNTHPSGIYNATFQLGAKADNRSIFIDENFSCSGINFGLNVSNYSINIGKDCMFSNEIVIDADDGHVIFKKGTQVCINKPKNIFIGNHVWCGRRVLICKGTKIQDGSVIGEGSIVNKVFEESNIIIAGIPAKIVKSNVQWERYNHNSLIK